MNTLYNKWGFLRKVLSDQPLKDKVPASPAAKSKDPKATKKPAKKPPQEPEEDFSKVFWRGGIKALAMLKNISANVSLTQGTVIPGFLHPTFAGKFCSCGRWPESHIEFFLGKGSVHEPDPLSFPAFLS